MPIDTTGNQNVDARQEGMTPRKWPWANANDPSEKEQQKLHGNQERFGRAAHA